MAPEVSRGEKYDHKIDCFSWAILSYQLFEENWGNPYGNSENISVEMKVAHQSDFRPVFSNENQTPTWFIEIVKKCWDDDPRNRLEFSEIIEAINKNKNIKVNETSIVKKTCRVSMNSSPLSSKPSNSQVKRPPPVPKCRNDR